MDLQLEARHGRCQVEGKRKQPLLEDNLRWKISTGERLNMTFDGDNFWLKTTFYGRQFLMEDDH